MKASAILDRAKVRRLAAGTPAERNVVDTFLIRATSDMLVRMHDGLRRGWGVSWQGRNYRDGDVVARLYRAISVLEGALDSYRDESVGIDELRKRAADVANQAFMLADPIRLREAKR